MSRLDMNCFIYQLKLQHNTDNLCFQIIWQLFWGPHVATLQRSIKKKPNLQLATLNTFSNDWMHLSMELKA